MLTATQMDNYANEIIDLYSEFEMELILDLASRVRRIDYNVDRGTFLISQGEQTKNLYNQTVKSVANLLQKSEKQVADILTRASKQSIRADDKIYINAGLEPIPVSQNIAMLQVLKANIIKTNGDLANLTRTTAISTQQSFINATNKAHLQILSNAFTRDKAVQMAIKEVAREGAYIYYPDGTKNTVESAVRRAIVTSISQTTGVLQEERLQELEVDLVETTSHGNSRPDHALWQGKVFSYTGSSDKYPNFKTSTGYGTKTGLKGINCRHDFFPYIEGTPRAIVEKEREVIYKGEKRTEYEISQIQRYNERQIRKWKRQKQSLKDNGFDAAFESAKVGEWQNKQRQLLKETGLRRDYTREQVG
jgi:hypothetical protein